MAATDWVRTPLGLLVPADLLQLERKTPSGVYVPSRYGYGTRFDRPTCVGLFVGAGGMSCGLVSAGFHEIAAVEWDTYAALTYMVNLGAHPIRIHYVEDGDKARLNRAVEAETKRHKRNGIEDRWLRSGTGWISHTEHPGCEDFWFGDICKVSGAVILAQVGMEPGEIDVVAGGPPCQGLSLANNKRRVDDPRNALLWEYMRLVEELRPKVFVLENVPQLLTAADGGFYKGIRDRAVAAGYNVVANVLNAADYGVPQNRRRAIVVGTQSEAGHYQFPYPTNWPLGCLVGGKPWDQWERSGEDDEEDAEDEPDGVGVTVVERTSPPPGKHAVRAQAELDFGS